MGFFTIYILLAIYYHLDFMKWIVQGDSNRNIALQIVLCTLPKFNYTFSKNERLNIEIFKDLVFILFLFV